jgi:arabinose-5-phosphate isomerase
MMSYKMMQQDISPRMQEAVIEDLLVQSQSQLAYFFERINSAQISEVISYILSGSKNLFFTGIGKSGIASKKIAMTMNSCGIKAFSLSALNAMHGDIGLVSEGDVVFMLSKSGESDELLTLCPALRNKGAILVAVVSKEESRLAKSSDFTVVLPVLRELCPFDLAPTTSTIVQIIFGDLLAVALMRAKNISIDEFSRNHPAGQIGKRLTLKVSELMLRGQALPLCGPEDKVVDMLVELSAKRCGTLLIIDERGYLLGIFTDGDLRRGLQTYGAEVLAFSMKDVMTKTARVVLADALAMDALEMMEADQKRAVTVLPVVHKEQDGMRLLGLLKLHDILQSGLK